MLVRDFFRGYACRAGAFRFGTQHASVVAFFLALASLAFVLGGCSSSTEPADDGGDKPSGPVISLWAGEPYRAAFDGDGHDLLKSWFFNPVDLEFTSTGIYILDWNNHKVRRVTPQNTLETVIGTDLVGDGDPDQQDLIPPGVPGTTIALNHPTDIDELPDGRILLTAWHNHKLRIYDPATGLAYVSCGTGAGFAGDGGPAKDALLWVPTQSVVAPDGTIYVVDAGNQRIRAIGTDDIIHTVVGNGEEGFSGDGGPPLEARLSLSIPGNLNPPIFGALAIDNQGRLYISDTRNHRIRLVDFAANKIETIVGDGTAGYGGDGGAATAASLNTPRDVEIGPDGCLYIVDYLNHRIRVVNLETGIIKTVVGNGNPGYSGDGGPAKEASLNKPEGIAFDAQGDLYVVDSWNHVIRKVDLDL